MERVNARDYLRNPEGNACMRPRRAQITFAFLVSAVMFVGLVIYITSTLFTIVNPHINAAVNQEGEAYAYMASNLLLSDAGRWDNGTANGTDWENHPQNTTSLGLASSYHRLSLSKIGNMSAMSSEQIRALLGDNHIYSFCIGSVYTQECDIMDKKGQFAGMMVTRYAVVENGTQTIPARITIEVL